MKEAVTTPEALIEKAKRGIAENVAMLVEAKIALGVAAHEWVDQHHSPLGKRRHLELTRTKRIPSQKHGKLILVKRDDLNAYIEREGLSRGVREQDETVDDVVDEILSTKTKGRRR